MKSIVAVMLGLSLQTLSGPTIAQTSQNEIDELRAQILALSNRLEQMELKNEALSNSIEETREVANSSSWISNIEISGDLRSRYERIDDNSKTDAKNRDRVRSRLDISAQVNEDWKMFLGLASGGDDPISTNQTLGNGASTKDFGLDYAYFEYHGMENLMVTGGKYKNVFFKPGGQNLIFDGDYRPEGAGMKYTTNNLFFNAATFLIESDDKAGSQDEELMWGVQLGYEIPLEGGDLTLGGSYFNASLKGSQPFYNNKSYSNSLDANGNYLYDYESVELFVEANLQLGAQPLRLYGDFVQNQDADKNDTGWVLGGKIGNVSGAGTWEFGYAFQDLEADAIYGALTDSDFANSGTDGKGHIIKGAYGLGRNTEMGIIYFLNKYGKASAGFDIDYDRLQVDLIVGF